MSAQTRRTQGIYHYQFFLEDRSSGTIVTKDISIAELTPSFGYEPEVWDNNLDEEDRSALLRDALADWVYGYIDYGWVTKPATQLPPPASPPDQSPPSE